MYRFVGCVGEASPTQVHVYIAAASQRKHVLSDAGGVCVDRVLWLTPNDWQVGYNCLVGPAVKSFGMK
jgi:hypothetical protein